MECCRAVTPHTESRATYMHGARKRGEAAGAILGSRKSPKPGAAYKKAGSSHSVVSWRSGWLPMGASSRSLLLPIFPSTLSTLFIAVSSHPPNHRELPSPWNQSKLGNTYSEHTLWNRTPFLAPIPTCDSLPAPQQPALSAPHTTAVRVPVPKYLLRRIRLVATRRFRSAVSV